MVYVMVALGVFEVLGFIAVTRLINELIELKE